MEPRSRVGIYVGYSPVHTENVVLVLNLRSGLMSPKHYVVFGDTFSTVPYMQAGSCPPYCKELVETRVGVSLS